MKLNVTLTIDGLDGVEPGKIVDALKQAVRMYGGDLGTVEGEPAVAIVGQPYVAPTGGPLVISDIELA